MVSFLISVLALVLGYFLYSKVVVRAFGADANRATPALTMRDDVDYVPLPWWKIFLIQFLNIAGLGPIFGAVAGAMWGPAAFLWIVLGTIFAGGVHDYLSGMLSLRHKGESITEVTGYYLGTGMKRFMQVFTIALMIMVGAVFITGPAKILDDVLGEVGDVRMWVWVIFTYYLISTVLPIDKVIAKIYPLFGIALLFMVGGIAVMMLTNGIQIPEITWSSLTNQHHTPEKFPLFPMLFITIACGAISGFHASQSPMMARCMTNEKQGRSIFYGTMVTEGIVALIWAAISMSFYGGVGGLNEVMVQQKGNAAFIVSDISNSLLGQVGGVLALLGVVAAPITSGDTAFRSARLIIADLTKSKQKQLMNRILISLPLFALGYGLTLLDFGIIWRYFAWTNQTLATIVLWVVTVYLIKEGKQFWISLLPAIFMSAVVTSYILLAPEGFNLPKSIAYATGISVSCFLLIITMLKLHRRKSKLKVELVQ
ncbi:carbon starvation protein CstA [Pontibacter mucosus]|uniref:Carbon starvation protein CstA n=1 Tax=Pontibacter mucosus TaxID=1649266 RepID=A0A2T5YHS0_9BACT|nr:carbon starvation protein A [Pontibacter mucosus]PTX18872.1 carbon starvation protein CstA [Pontibacter mucosus]